jgi:subtilisin-like proprotein convertase family protein
MINRNFKTQKAFIMKMRQLMAMTAAMALVAGVARAQITNSFSFNVNEAVPDGNALGLTVETNLTVPGGLISSVTLSLNLLGGYNGDIYAYLRGPNGGFAVLLNRVGISGVSGNSTGYSNTGFNLTFDGTATDDIHFYQNVAYGINGSGQVTGIWQPDGRNIDPLSSPSTFDSASRDALLNSFDGTDPNGTWTLFLADMASGSQSTLVDWTLIMTVPEPSSLALAGMGLAILLGLGRHMRRARA